MAITNASRLANFGTGIGTQGAIIQVDNANQRLGIGTAEPSSMLQVGLGITMDGTSGVITATSFVGDGSGLKGVASAGLGTALSAVDTHALNDIYYTNNILHVGITTVINTPATSDHAYTQYTDIRVDENVDLSVASGDDFIPDVLDLVSGSGYTPGTGGSVSIAGIDTTGTSTFNNINASGVITATSYNGSGASLTGIRLSEVDLWIQSSKGSSTGALGLDVLLGGAQARTPVGVRATNFFSKVGVGMTHAAGIWTFPSTGMWEVITNVSLDGNTTTTLNVYLRASLNSGSSWTIAGEGDVNGDGDILIPFTTFLNVTDASTFRLKCEVSSTATHAGLYGGPQTFMSFKKIA